MKEKNRVKWNCILCLAFVAVFSIFTIYMFSIGNVLAASVNIFFGCYWIYNFVNCIRILRRNFKNNSKLIKTIDEYLS